MDKTTNLLNKDRIWIKIKNYIYLIIFLIIFLLIILISTLILATPKSDVEQAVGRILRQKNKNEPLVIDIVDSFSIFKGQYFKRKKFYKTQEFKIK